MLDTFYANFLSEEEEEEIQLIFLRIHEATYSEHRQDAKTFKRTYKKVMRSALKKLKPTLNLRGREIMMRFLNLFYRGLYDSNISVFSKTIMWLQINEMKNAL